MRLKLFLLLSILSAGAYAADNARKLQPAPPPPALDSAGNKDATPAKSNTGNASSAEAPQVTITKQTDQTVEEYRVGGKLYMIKIIPKIGKPYYLVDDRGDGKFVRQDTLDNGFRVPRWIIHRF
jgi:hypothetical protein